MMLDSSYPATREATECTLSGMTIFTMLFTAFKLASELDITRTLERSAISRNQFGRGTFTLGNTRYIATAAMETPPALSGDLSWWCSRKTTIRLGTGCSESG